MPTFPKGTRFLVTTTHRGAKGPVPVRWSFADRAGAFALAMRSGRPLGKVRTSLPRQPQPEREEE